MRAHTRRSARRRARNRVTLCHSPWSAGSAQIAADMHSCLCVPRTLSRRADEGVLCPWGEGVKRAAGRALPLFLLVNREWRYTFIWDCYAVGDARYAHSLALGRWRLGRDDLAKSSDRRPSSPLPAGLVSGSHA